MNLGWGGRSCLPIAALACLLAGCLGQSPFQPAPVRFGGVDYLEALEAPPTPIDVRLDRITFSADDALVATVLLDASLVGKDRSARLTVLDPAGRPAAKLDLVDLRNTEMIVHVQLRSAPAGNYTLRVEAGSLSAEKTFAVSR